MLLSHLLILAEKMVIENGNILIPSDDPKNKMYGFFNSVTEEYFEFPVELFRKSKVLMSWRNGVFSKLTTKPYRQEYSLYEASRTQRYCNSDD